MPVTWPPLVTAKQFIQKEEVVEEATQENGVGVREGEGGVVPSQEDHKDFSSASAFLAARKRSGEENLSGRKFWQRRWGAPSVICGMEHRKPHPKASLSEVAQRGNHKKALKLCHSEILTHPAVGAVCTTCKRSPKKQNFYSAFPASPPLAGKQGPI